MRGQLLAYGIVGALVGAWLFLPAGLIVSSTRAWTAVLWDAFGPQVASLLAGTGFTLPGASVVLTAILVVMPRAAFVAWRVLRFRRRLAARKAVALPA